VIRGYLHLNVGAKDQTEAHLLLNTTPASIDMAKMVEKIPGWVERLLIPTLESKVRGIVTEEVGHLEKVLDARFDGINSEIRRVDEKVGSLEKRFDERMGSLEKRIDEKMGSMEKRVDERMSSLGRELDEKFGSLEKRFPAVQEMAEIKARLSQVESKVSSR
jgi:hypothetical protein